MPEEKTQEINRLSLFTSMKNSMVATNDNSYRNSNFRWESDEPLFRDYTLEQIQDILKGTNREAQSLLSREFIHRNGYYRQIIAHYATLLKYCGVLIPFPAFGKSLQKTSLAKRYYGALNLLDKFNLDSWCYRVGYKTLVDGMYYGAIVQKDKEDLIIMDLPFKYCRTRFKDYNDRDIVEFDTRFFDQISMPDDREAALKAYPKVISSYYRKTKKKTPWVFLPTDIGVAFNLFENCPYFLNSIPAIMQYDTAVSNEQQREIEEIKKLIVQTVPHLNDGTLLMEPNEAEVMHEGVVNMIRDTNPNASVLTTYADVEVFGAKSADSVTNNTLTNMLNHVYATAGAAKEIFGATGSASIGSSLKEDINLMMVLANKIGNWISWNLNDVFGSKEVQFKYEFLPISIHNDKETIDNYFKLASSGYSFLLPSIAAGLSQKELCGIKDLENNLLKLGDLLLPLQSSYTQSGGSSAKGNDNGNAQEEDKGGRPALEPEDRTEKTNQNKESADKTGG